MPYEALVSRALPGLVVFALDDSGSMVDNLPGTSDPKHQYVSRYTGIVLQELLKRSTEVTGKTVLVKPRFYISTILYGSKPKLWGDPIMDIETAVKKYAQAGNSLGLGAQLGGTDGQAALQMARDIVAQALTTEQFKTSFPPMVFHLTDGMSATDPSAVAEQIKQLSTSDGNVLVVNAYIGTETNLNYQGPDDFPGYLDPSEAGNQDNLILFNMSSVAPETITNNLIAQGIFPKFRPGSRLFFDVRTREMLKNVLQVVSSIPSRAAR